MSESFVPLGFKGLRIEDRTDARGEVVIYSASLPFRWYAPVVVMERCEECGAASPGKNCNCGIHANFHVGVIITEYMESPHAFMALVEGRGIVRLGQWGWRAQQCAVMAVLTVSPTDMVRQANNERAANYFEAQVMSLEKAVETVEGWKRYYAKRLGA